MHESLHHLDHRPWPLPSTRWTWRQDWLDAGFLHWRADSREITRHLPPGLTLQEFDGSAWIGLVPFRMAGVMRRPFPDLPGFSSFPELNLRTYVEHEGRAGVWFFSLDAASRSMVWGGRTLYGLPYHHARMRLEKTAGWTRLTSRRLRGEARFAALHRPIGEATLPRPGTFEHWAVERYCLYAHTRRGLARVDVHHAPWPICPAEFVIEENTILEAARIEPLSDSMRCHCSPGVRVVSFPAESLAGFRPRVPR
ncbi:DUF2071 domain-containing protein [Opitutales bacterium ASA1]|uniref:YqjF family protein n=1 Tax=Congregicoccus parvus TaxID=3081749 RepID=UPI002B29A129|nr:DUF2071 domain-containing protein [Opitutales bacterium ASA1]